MAKGKGKINSSGGLAPPKPRSLRSRKRESSSDQIPQILHLQDMEENNTTVAGTPLQHPQSSLQECAMIADQQDQAVGLSCLTNQDDSKEEKHEEETNVYLTNMTVKAFEGQEETTVTSPSNDSEVVAFRVHTDNDTNKNGMEEITPQEGIGSPSQTCNDQLQVFLPTSEEGDACASALEKQLAAKDNSQCPLERNYEAGQEEPSNLCMADVKEITKEAEAGLPAKKKRRMGMCGLTERERSQFLQTQKRENGQNRAERVERQIYISNTADLVGQEEVTSSLLCPSSPLSISVDHITEQNKAEMKLQSSLCGGDDRAESEVHIAVTTSDGTGTVCEPGCSEGKSREAEGGTEAGPEQTDAPKSDPPAQVEVEEHVWNREPREVKASTTEIMTKTPEIQREDGEDRSSEADCSPAVSFDTNPPQCEETEKKKDGRETASLQVHRTTKTISERKEEKIADADVGAEVEGASSTFAQTGGFNCGSVELCEAAVTPTGSERKESYDPEDEPGPSTGNTEHTQTRDTADPFGSGCLDYVSDSQLNTIVLIEEVVMEKEGDPGSSDCHEDATDLICGLIRELSSLKVELLTLNTIGQFQPLHMFLCALIGWSVYLAPSAVDYLAPFAGASRGDTAPPLVMLFLGPVSRKVMATHRGLENLRRGSKTPRSSNR